MFKTNMPQAGTLARSSPPEARITNLDRIPMLLLEGVNSLRALLQCNCGTLLLYLSSLSLYAQRSLREATCKRLTIHLYSVHDCDKNMLHFAWCSNELKEFASGSFIPFGFWHALQFPPSSTQSHQSLTVIYYSHSVFSCINHLQLARLDS